MATSKTITPEVKDLVERIAGLMNVSGAQKIEAEYYGEGDEGSIDKVVAYDLDRNVVTLPEVDQELLEELLWDLLGEHLRPGFWDGSDGGTGTLAVKLVDGKANVTLNHQVREWVSDAGEDFTV